MEATKALVLVAVVAAGVHAQLKPHITENFQAWTVVSTWNSTDRWQLVEHIEHDLTARKQRVDTWINNTQDEFLARWDMTPPKEYVIVQSADGKWCGNKDLEGQMEPWWGWLSYVKKAGECNVNFVHGQGWTAHFHDAKKKVDVRLDLCFGVNNKPLDLFIHYKNENAHEEAWEHVTFEDFIDGASPAANFDVPSVCSSHSSQAAPLKPSAQKPSTEGALRPWRAIRSMALW